VLDRGCRNESVGQLHRPMHQPNERPSGANA
jgi:hypothetical protein